MSFCSDHDHLYFDALIRTKKAEAVLSLIHATYQSWEHNKNKDNVKNDIARLFKISYELFKYDVGSYDGSVKKFESQYTIGHELGIWKNSNLELSDLALKVAKNDITIKDYFDVVFLNYIQPIDGIVINPLYLILSFLNDKKYDTLTKNHLKNIFSFASNNTANEINGLFNMLIGTNYFSVISNSKNELKINCDIQEIISKCNLKYHKKNYTNVKNELDDLSVFVNYLQTSSEENKTNKQEKIIYNDTKWLFSANPSKYDHVNSFKTNGAIEWHMSCKLKVGDLVFLYSTKPIQKITHLAIVDKIDISKEEREIDDAMFWKVNENSSYSKYAKLILLETVDNEMLSLEKLTQHGLNAAPQGPIKIDDKLFDYIKPFFNFFDVNSVRKEEAKYTFVGNAYNKIYYGIPGCGKSFKIDNEILINTPKENIFRTTFYLDYTNSDFIGQIMPVINENNVIYDHIAGPFTKALSRALETNDTVYLIIEEINRGNAAAIFGDIFQLLDRKKEGFSNYPITNEFIETYILKNNHYNIKNNVLIPSNLTILATMNTSDQGVFPLDTAFKRRWELERVIDANGSYDIDNLMVPYTNHTWKEFREKVNQAIQSKSKDGTVSVDKQLGRGFVKENMLTSSDNIHNKNALNRFVNNVLDYLYSDVCKFDKNKFFNEDYSFDHICRIIDNYKEDQTYDLELKIFEENENEQ